MAVKRVGAVGWLNSCLGEVVEFLFVTLKQKLNEPLLWMVWIRGMSDACGRE